MSSLKAMPPALEGGITFAGELIHSRVNLLVLDGHIHDCAGCSAKAADSIDSFMTTSLFPHSFAHDVLEMINL